MEKLSTPKRAYAFIDGSYDPKSKVYGFGGFLVDQFGRKHIVQGSGDDPILAKMRNIAGEERSSSSPLNFVCENSHFFTIMRGLQPGPWNDGNVNDR